MTQTSQAAQYAAPVITAQLSVVVRSTLQPQQSVSVTGAPSGAIAGARRGAVQYARALEDLADR